MFRNMCHAKLHLATVTHTRLTYEGSIAIDRDFLDAVGLKPYELVHVVNRNNGIRAETYIIEAERGSRSIGINGALARHAEAGDRVIIIAYKWLAEAEIPENYSPRVLKLDEHNRVIDAKSTVA